MSHGFAVGICSSNLCGVGLKRDLTCVRSVRTPFASNCKMLDQSDLKDIRKLCPMHVRGGFGLFVIWGWSCRNIAN